MAIMRSICSVFLGLINCDVYGKLNYDYSCRREIRVRAGKSKKSLALSARRSPKPETPAQTQLAWKKEHLPRHRRRDQCNFPPSEVDEVVPPSEVDDPPVNHGLPASSRGGGVAIYVRRGLAAQHITLPSSGIECTALRIILPKRKRLVVVVSYGPPDVDSDLFLDSLEDVITPYLSANLCLLGDFNAKNSAWFCGQV